MSRCCNDKDDELVSLRARQGWALYLALVINGVMFLAEFAGGLLAESTALLGDSLDMLGDASVYAVTLYALSASARTRAGIAMLKGLAMAVFGVFVLIQAARHAVAGAIPDVGLMLKFGGAALIANLLCFALLYRHRSDDLNLHSAWLCSRNDLIGNLSVLVAAGTVYATGMVWPDIVVGTAIALLFLHSGQQVLLQAWAEWRGESSVLEKQKRVIE